MVGPIALLLLIGGVVLSLGVYRYQQVGYLARAGARYASTHGAQYRVDNQLAAGNTTSWKQEIRNNGVLPRISSLHSNLLTVDASWSTGDNEANAADPNTEFTTTIKNSVTVTVDYQWFPETFLNSPIVFSSSSTMPMVY